MSKKNLKIDQPKILNFVEAIYLAKYVATASLSSIDLSMGGMENLLSKLPAVSLLEILKILTGNSSEDLNELVGKDALSILFSGLYINRINQLLEFAQSERIINVI